MKELNDQKKSDLENLEKQFKVHVNPNPNKGSQQNDDLLSIERYEIKKLNFDIHCFILRMENTKDEIIAEIKRVEFSIKSSAQRKSEDNNPNRLTQVVNC